VDFRSLAGLRIHLSDLSTKLFLPDETNVCRLDRRRRMKRVVTAFALQIGGCALP